MDADIGLLHDWSLQEEFSKTAGEKVQQGEHCLAFC